MRKSLPARGVKRSRRRWAKVAVRRVGLLPAVGAVLAVLITVTVVVWGGFSRLLRGRWPWQLGGLDNSASGFQTTQIALTVIGGLGAAVALVVAYRRQRDLEQARFDERFAAASGQLGAVTAIERIAGVAAMAALADQWNAHRQQCINVLCGYLRLPYDPSTGLLKSVVSEHTWPVGGLDMHGRGATGKETRTYEQLPNDREVRFTVISTITAHLQDFANNSWQGNDFDFTGVTFDGGSFAGAEFSGGTVNFKGATFSGGYVDFSLATFSGGTVNFDGATFSGGTVNFSGATFSGGYVDFLSATFSGGTVGFRKATFSGGTVGFREATFSGGTVDFGWGATFSGSRVQFNGATFSGGTVDFGSTSYAGTTFDSRATFSGGTVDFNGATFSSGTVTLDRVDFRGWPHPITDS